MNINNYFKKQTFAKKEYDCFEVRSQGYETERFRGTMKECNKFIADTFKNNKLLYCKLDYVAPCYEECVYFEDGGIGCGYQYKTYCNDFKKYVKLFLFRKIGVMSIVNLIINGNYFTNHYCLRELLFEFDSDDMWGFETFEEYINDKIEDKILINGMCNNFKKLQFLE